MRRLRADFSEKFNILPLPVVFDYDWAGEAIQLHLKHVTASEIFNAMNLVFENDRKPVRWELKNSNCGLGAVRSIARVAQAAAAATASAGASPAKPPTERMVFFVGNLVGDEKSGGLTMDQITKTILDVWPADFGNAEGVIQFHKEAQLLVVNGTAEEISFMHQTLAALKEKAESAIPKTETSKAIDEAIQKMKLLKNLDSDSK